MKDLYKSTIGRLRIVGFIEGLSYLILLFIAMPIKYLVGIPEPVRMTGMAHGLLFVLYILLVIQATIQYNWSLRKAFIAFLASLVPFGTFYADIKLFRDEEEANA
jgi:integral membrane protein